MVPPRSFVLCALGVALTAAGFGMGLLAGSGSGVRVIHVPDRSVPPDSRSPEPTAAPPAPKARPEPPPLPPSPPGTVPTELRESLRGILERIREAAPPRGTGSITGTVRTGDGTPLAGFEVVCSPRPTVPRGPARPFGAPPRQNDPVDSAVMTFREARFFARPAWTTTTTSAGEFRFDGLADVEHFLCPRKRGWEVVGESSTDVRPGADLRFTAVRVSEVWFEVTAADGGALEEVRIVSRGPARRGTWPLDPENPVARLHPGTYEFSAESGEMSSEAKSVEVPDDGEPLLVRLQLRAPR